MAGPEARSTATGDPASGGVIEQLLAEFLPRQRWYSGTSRPESVTLWHHEALRDDWPALVHLLVDADGARYQVPVGLRPPSDAMELLRNQDQAVLGDVATVHGPAVAYDAACDPELGLLLLEHTGAERAERVRPMSAEQSNTSLVFDERVILKIFRRLHPGPNPEVEVTEALERFGFPWVAAPLATWNYEDLGVYHDLAVVQPYLAGGVEGWALALTSLRDLFGVHDTQSIPIIDLSAEMPPGVTDPGQAGGDFSDEARRLGETTAELHGAMAEGFGRAPGDSRSWADSIDAEVTAAGDEFDLDLATARRLVQRLRGVREAGLSIRVHGDYHLGQVMRTDAGWYVLDFEGEPARPLEQRRRPSSPLRDVAGMLRSFHYAAAVSEAERSTEHGVPGELKELGCAWEERNRQAFLDGYLPAAAKAGVVPGDHDSAMAVLEAFELEKAVYELRYERAHRPEWEHIPLTGVRRLLEREANR